MVGRRFRARNRRCDCVKMFVRAIEERDLNQLPEMCREHAAFERREISAPEASLLHSAFFDPPARLHGWVAHDGHGLLGYATATIDFSTWRARAFMHLDCLYVRERARGRNVGSALLVAVCERARDVGIDELQWQTPDWNLDAQRFYRRHGAMPSDKVRFILSLHS